MSKIVTLKSFPYDSLETEGVYDREYEAKIFRDYFAKFLSNGVYFGTYKNYGENSLKVTLDGNLSVKINKGCGLIEGTDFELEDDQVITLNRPDVGTRTDKIIIKADNTLATRATHLYVKSGDTELQRDENIYEICIAEVTVKATANLTEADIVDTRLNKEVCGIVNSLITVDGEELYQQFKEYIDTVMENLVRKDQDNVINGKITATQFIGDLKGSVDGNSATATTASSCTGNSATASKLQIPRNIKIQGVVSGNADFDGSENVIITTIQNNIAIVTGNITLTNGTGNIDLDYPSGYNVDNTVLLSVAINFANGYVVGYYGNFAEFNAILTNSKIKVNCLNGTASSAGPSKNYPVKVVIMKKT